MYSLELPRHWKADMRFGAWTVRSLYRALSLKTVWCKLAKYNFGIVIIQDVRRDKDGNDVVSNYAFFCGNGNADCHLRMGIFIHNAMRSAIKRV